MPIKPLLPLIVSQYVSVWNTVKNNVPTIVYKITKNKLTIICKIFLLNIKSKELLAIGFSQSERIKSMLFFLHSFKFIFATSIASE